MVRRVDEEKKDETTEETTEEKTEETTEEVKIKPDFEALYNERTAEVEKLHREIDDLHRDREELQRKLDDATRAFSIIADRLGMIDVADVVDNDVDNDGYVDTIDASDLDKYIDY
jgi:uncharacterized protein YlxW (UPF0749 family)